MLLALTLPSKLNIVTNTPIIKPAGKLSSNFTKKVKIMLKDTPEIKNSMVKLDKEELIAKLAPAISAKPEIVFAYLFGSVAKGTAGHKSDVDVAVFLDPSFALKEEGFGYLSILTEELSALLGRRVDVVILNSVRIVLKHQVLKSGLLLHTKSNEARRTFHERTIREYLDFKPALRVQREYLHKRLLNGTFGGGHSGR